MRKRWVSLLLCIVILISAPASAAAAGNSDGGFYDVGSATRVEIIPVDASGKAVPAVSRDVDGRPGNERFYPGSRALRVTLAGTVPGKMYLLTVSAGSVVHYADQQTGGGLLSFVVAFALPDRRTELTLSIGSNAAGFTKITLPLSYTPHAEGSASSPDLKTGYNDCTRNSACPMASYVDLSPRSWYHDGVHWALENNVMNGVGDQSFAPNSPTSRAMIVTVLWRLEGEPVSDAAMTFTDVPDQKWYTEAIRWAASEEIVNGTGAEHFAPNDNVTREQLATILCRYAKYKGTDERVTGSADLSIFTDAEHISRWAKDGVQWAVNAGLITGMGNDELSPKTDASRAQVTTMLMRYSAK